jgi:signal transduction histidine kinase
MNRTNNAAAQPPRARPPSSSRAARIALAVVFAMYLTGLVSWLLLGILPTLAHDVPAVHSLLTTIQHMGTGVGNLAGRVLGIDTDDLESAENPWLQYGFSLLNVVLGILLALRKFDQPVPRLLAFALLGTAATFNDVSHRAFHITGSPWPIALAHFTFHVVSGVTYFWAVVLFPDGRVPQQLRLNPTTRRLTAAALSLGIVGICYASSFIEHPQFFVVFFGIVIPLAGAGTQWLRLADRSTTPAQAAAARLLLGSLLPALAVALGWLLAKSLGALGVVWALRTADLVQTAFPLVFAIVPVVLTAGVVRYRLWDLDRLLVKVLVYGLIGTLIVGVYVLAALVGSQLAGGIWWLVLLLSLAAVALEPLRRLATRWANRIVYGQLLSPTEAIGKLVDGLQQLSPGSGLDQITRVAVDATRASSASLWLIAGDQLVPADGIADPVPLADAPLLREDNWPVRYQGETLGYLLITTPPAVNLTPADRRFLDNIAAHAGLLVHNAVLSLRLVRQIQTLSAKADELAGTRRQVVAAQDNERRQLERDLHDGAQQAVVAGIIGLRTAAAGDPTTADFAELHQVLGLARQWLNDLGDDASTGLLDHGLAAALEQAAKLARRGGLRVDIHVDDAHSWTAEVQRGVFFCCSEALQNIVKYASATRAEIEVTDTDGMVTFLVSDNGIGFEPTTADTTGGLAKLAERCMMLGGMLAVDSRTGSGTRVEGRIPIAATAAALPVAG